MINCTGPTGPDPSRKATKRPSNGHLCARKHDLTVGSPASQAETPVPPACPRTPDTGRRQPWTAKQGPALDRSNHRLLFRTGLARNAYPDTHVSDQLGDYQVADLRTSRVAGFLEASTVRWLRQEGRFAPGIRVGRRIVWDEAQLLAWVEANLRNDSSSTAA